MSLTEAIAALRAKKSHHTTPSGVHIGFIMSDVTAVFGSLALSSETLAMLMVQGLVESEPVILNGEVQTIYRVADASPPKSRSVH